MVHTNDSLVCAFTHTDELKKSEKHDNALPSAQPDKYRDNHTIVCTLTLLCKGGPQCNVGLEIYMAMRLTPDQAMRNRYVWFHQGIHAALCLSTISRDTRHLSSNPKTSDISPRTSATLMVASSAAKRLIA